MYHPLTWLAVGCHVLLLMVPFGGDANSDLAKMPEEDIEAAIPVDLLNLSDIATSTPPASEPPLPAEPAAPPPPELPPEPGSQLPSQTVTTSESAPAPANEVIEPMAAPIETAPEPVAVSQETPLAYDPAQDQSVFIANLEAVGLNDYTDQGLPPSSFFRSPENASYFLNENAPAPGATSARWVDKSPADVLAQLQTSYAPTGIAFTKLDDYAGELLYQLTTPTGETFMHVSLVRLKGSTLLVIWQDRPA